MKHIAILCALLLLTLGCSDQQTPTILSEESAVLAKSVQIDELIKSGPITFSGVHNYYTYASKNKETLQDTDIPTRATLTSIGGQKVRLALVEHAPDGDRMSIFEGKLTPSGVLKVEIIVPPPDVLIQIVKMHSGCTVSGPFPVYHGSFDGERLYARTIFKSKCPVDWPANEIFETPVDGPVHWQWTMDFTMED